jgi:phage tail sheath protein FI
MAFNIGVNVVEVEGTAAPTIVAAPVSTAGFLIGAERGVPNVPVKLRSFGDFVTAFGSYTSRYFGAHALNGFFQNGGAEAWAVRVAGSPNAPAAATLSDSGGAAVLNLRAGMRGQDDPGEWGNELSVAVADSPQGTSQVPAQIVSANAEPFALVANSEISVTVNGAATAVRVQFRSADFADIAHATASEVAAVIDRASPSLRAVATPGRRVLLASATPGTASHLAVAAPAPPTADATGPLGFTASAVPPTDNSSGGIPVASSTLVAVQSPAGFEPGAAVRIETRGRVVGVALAGAPAAPPAGFDVTPNGGAVVAIRFTATDFVGGWAAPTVGEIVAAIRRQARGFTADLTHDNRIVLVSDLYGTGSSILVAPPPAGVADARAWLGLTPAAQGGARELTTIATVAESDRYVTLPSALGAVLPQNFARLQTIEFRLTVSRRGTVVETWDGLSMQPNVDGYAPAVLNDADAGSRYVSASDPNAAAPGVKNPPATATPFGGGSETAAPSDAAWVGDAAARTGLYAFDTARIQLLTCTETTSSGVLAAALTYCENRGDAMFVGTTPFGFDRDGIKTYAAPFRAKKVYGALYAPWIQIANPLDTGNTPRVFVPPVGHVLGVYARIAASGGVWRAPAGDDAQLRLVLGTEFPMTDADLTDLVENGSVNGVRAVPGSGIVVDSSRTLSTDTRWLYVNVRRLFNFVKVSLRDSLRFVAQEPHDEALRRRVKFNVVLPFLLGLWSQGAFGSDPAEQVFTIKCDETNNPPARVQQGFFTLEVFFYPVKPAEKIIITVGQQDSGATASES